MLMATFANLPYLQRLPYRKVALVAVLLVCGCTAFCPACTFVPRGDVSILRNRNKYSNNIMVLKLMYFAVS